MFSLIMGHYHVSGTTRREEIRSNFNKLVYARYVERCPKPEPFFNPLGDEEQTSARKKVTKVCKMIPVMDIPGHFISLLSNYLLFSLIMHADIGRC
jgi:translation initiation factor 2 gamma subunit (eIF-2gamma)